MELRRDLVTLWARLPFIIAAVVIAAGAAYVYSQLQPTVYEADATLVVGQSLSSVSPDYTTLLASQSLSSTYATVATTRPVLQGVIDRLGLSGTTDDLARRVSASAAAGSTLLTITAQDHDPSVAAAIANAIAQGLIVASPAVQGRTTTVQSFVDADLQSTQQQIEAAQAEANSLAAITTRTAAQETRLETLQAELTTLQSTYATLLGYSSSGSANLLSVIDQAVAPATPISPRPFLNVLLAVTLALIVSVSVVLFIARLHDTVDTADEVEELTGLPTLGTVLRMQSPAGRDEIYAVATLVYPRSAAAEAYRTLRTNVDFTALDEPIRTLLVTSAAPSEGKTVTASNLAIAFALAGRRVMLVDADLRRPGLHTIFDLPNTLGLTTLLQSDQVSVDRVAHANVHERFRVLTSGPLPPNPADIVGSERMRRVFEHLQESADLVIVDSPPLQAVADAAILSSYLDRTLLVIDSNRTRSSTVHLARETLAKANARVIGVVLNKVATGRYAEDHPYGAYYDETSAAGPGTPVSDAAPPAAVTRATARLQELGDRSNLRKGP